MRDSLAQFIKRKMRSKDLDQKQLAVKIQERLESWKEPAERTTVQTKLSKFLKDKPEGRTYFLAADHPRRLEALAKELGVDQAEIRKRETAATQTRTLVLDPRLEEKALKFFEDQVTVAGGTYRCVLVPSSECVPADLAKAAALARNPLVVLSVGEDGKLMDFAKIPHTTCREVPRGWVLLSNPNLVPLRNALKPKSPFEEGVPLIPISDGELGLPIEQYFQVRPKFLQRLPKYAQEQWDRGERPTLAIWDAIEFFSGEGRPLGDAAAVRFHFEQDDDPKKLADPGTTWVWGTGRDGGIAVSGPKVGKVRDLFGRHHKVKEVALAKELARIMSAQSNPWIVQEAAKTVGSPYLASRNLPSFERALGKWSDTAIHDQLHRKWDLGETRSEAPAGTHDAKDLAKLIAKLSGREFEEQVAFLMLELQQIANAPLVALPPNAGWDLRGFGHLGGGWIALVAVKKYDSEPRSLRIVGTWHGPVPTGFDSSVRLIEGGDVLVAFRFYEDVVLEGTKPLGRSRRIREEAARSSDDD